MRKVGVNQSTSSESGQDPDALRHLVEHSAAVGTLDQPHYRNLTRALELEQLTIGDIVSRSAGLSNVDVNADAAEIQETVTG